MNKISEEELEAEIQNQIGIRNPFSQSFDESLEEYRVFLQSSFSIQSWISVRQDQFLFPTHDQLPPVMWGEILVFLSDNSSTLHEAILVPDLRSGFLYPFPICSFSPKEAPLLSMIPLIEGIFRVDWWTMERLYRLGLRTPYELECN